MTKRKSWAARIEAAEKRGKFTRYEAALARDSWTTCAVGEKHNWASSFYDRADEEDRLGLAFGEAVNDDDVPLAKYLYEQIQALP